MESDKGFESGYDHGRLLSHFLVDVTAYGRDNLSRVLMVAFSNTFGGQKRATHFRFDNDQQLTLYVEEPKRVPAQAFPEPLSHPQAEAFVWDWLERVTYPPDEHDGASREGWRVFNERYGIVDNCWNAFIAIRPVWIYFPK